MNELLKVNFDTQTVSARDLHEKLEVKTKYADWFPRMCEYGFAENADYSTVSQKRENGGRTIEHDISIDMAKQICMIQRSEKGRQCRQYFIELEKAWNTPEQIFARALKMADERIHTLQVEVTEMKPKALFADAVSASHTSILIGDLAKLICQNGYTIGQKRLFTWLRDNGYLIKSGNSRNMPTQRFLEQGLFEVKESNVQNPDGSVRITKTTKCTGKGQVYFVNKFLMEIGAWQHGEPTRTCIRSASF